jgi:hypothetical protein
VEKERMKTVESKKPRKLGVKRNVTIVPIPLNPQRGQLLPFYLNFSLAENTQGKGKSQLF